MDEIDKLATSMELETKDVKNELFRLCWYMRGGMTITEAYNLAPDDREIIGKIIEDNLETTKKSGIPFF
jgi:hypothetical protein